MSNYKKISMALCILSGGFNMTLKKFFKDIDNNDYIILDEKGNKKELTTLIAMADVVRINIYNETVYITVR